MKIGDDGRRALLLVALSEGWMKLGELTKVKSILEKSFEEAHLHQSVYTFTSIAEAFMKIGESEKAKHSLEKALESSKNAKIDDSHIEDLCKIVNIWAKLGELVKAKDILKETTESVHQLECDHDRSRSYQVIKRALMEIVDTVSSGTPAN